MTDTASGAPGPVGSPAGTETAQPPATGTPGQGSQSQTDEYSPFARDYLQRVPEDVRAQLEPHVKSWDAGVTRRFQELHGQLKPWQDLGLDPEQVANAHQVYELLQNEPEVIYNLLKAELEGGGEQQNAPGGAGPGSAPLQGLPEELQGPLQQYLQPFEQQLTTMRNVLEKMAEQHLESRRTAEERAEDEELDQLFSSLNEEYGEFDEDFVIARLQAGRTPDEAMQDWQNTVQKILNSNGAGPRERPPTLSGAGVVPQSTQSVTEVAPKDLRAFVADMVRQSQQQGR